MDPDFWLQRWARGETGFHHDGVNPGLITHAPRLLGPAPRRVLVPLCGMTHDLDWLVDQGHEVLGVELSGLALAQVLARLGAPVTPEPVPGGRRHRHGRLTLLEGDIFALALDPVDAIWDRAALIALDPPRRPAYAARLRASLRPGGRILLTSLTCEPGEGGPPHSVPEAELRALFDGCRFERLDEQDMPVPGTKWAARGLRRVTGTTWLITPEGPGA